MAVKATDINFQGQDQDPIGITERIFRERGDGRYSLELMPIGITLEVDRLRRESRELTGEVMVAVDPKRFKHAKSYNGVISVGDLNFSSVQARVSRGKLLAERSGADHLDWYGFVEELCIRTVTAERAGKPAIILADLPDDEEKVEAWEIKGFPLLKDLPMVLYGDAGSGKSYFAMYIVGELCAVLADAGLGVLYVDWEFSHVEHRKRLGRLFQPMPRNLHYVRCDKSISNESDRLLRLAREHKAAYVVCDSIGFAIDGPAETQEAAMKYFRVLRQLGIGSMSLAHIPKQYDDGREAQIFGSVFFKAGARSAWFVDKATTNPKNEIRFALHHRKSNVGELLQPRGYRLLFEGKKRAYLETVDVKSVDELATSLPLLDRVKLTLQQQGAMTLKALGEDLSVPPASLRSIFSRHKAQFVKMGNKYGVLADGVDF